MEQFTQTIEDFLKSDAPTLVFPISLTSDERKIVHAIAEKMGYKSFSSGAGNARHITVTRERLSSSDISPATLKRFCSDFLIPIEIFDSPMFEYYIDLYDPVYHTKEKLKYLHDAIQSEGSETAFWKHYADVSLSTFLMLTCKVKEAIHKHFKSKEGYQRMSESGGSRDPPQKIGNTDIFKNENHHKWFISVDLRRYTLIMISSSE
jgi:hypothetical protein